MITSAYQESTSQLALDIHSFLIRELDLPTPFRSTDPIAGERMGLLTPQDFNRVDSLTLYLNCVFQASAGFTDYWPAFEWSIGVGMNLESALPKVKQAIDKRGILAEFERSSNISIGNPRAPLQQPNGQQNHLWIVDVICPCRLKLLIYFDPICGQK